MANKKVYIGGDSAGVGGYDYDIREDKKVFKKGEIVFGFTSSFRMGQLLQYSLTIPEQHPNKSDFDYLCTDFMDAVIKCFKDNGYAKTKENEVSGGVFLLGYHGQLYTIYSDFQVSKTILPFASCGCGESYALGALAAMSHNMKPEAKITKALEIAVSFSAGVKPPFHIVKV